MKRRRKNLFFSFKKKTKARFVVGVIFTKKWDFFSISFNMEGVFSWEGTAKYLLYEPEYRLFYNHDYFFLTFRENELFQNPFSRKNKN